MGNHTDLRLTPQELIVETRDSNGNLPSTRTAELLYKKHDKDYKESAYKQYTMQELGMWVHLLSTRATHRDDVGKRNKDLYDAQNYLDMMQEKLNDLK